MRNSCASTQVPVRSFEKKIVRFAEEKLVEEWWGDWLVTRALRNHNVWLTLMYVGLILLMARVYA